MLFFTCALPRNEAALTLSHITQARRGLLQRRVWDSTRCASSISGAEKVNLGLQCTFVLTSVQLMIDPGGPLMAHHGSIASKLRPP